MIAVVCSIVPKRYVSLKVPLYINENREEVQYWFVSDAPAGLHPWNDLVIEFEPGMTGRRELQRHKMLTHNYLPEFKYVVYIDGSARLKVDPVGLVQLMKDTGNSVMFGVHPWRDCLYEEARVVRGFSSQDPAVVDAQMKRYLDAGYPEHNGLVASTFFVRDNQDPKVSELFDTWYSETMAGSHRNQLSFNYAAWKTGVPFHTIKMGWGHNAFYTMRKEDK